MYTLNDIKNYSRVYGWISLFLVPLRYIQSKIFVYKQEIILYKSLQKIPIENKELKDFVFRKAFSKDLEKLKEIKPNTELFKKWLENESLFIIALKNNKIVGYTCVEFYPQKPIDRVLKLQQNEAWGRDAFILPEYRNKGIYSIMFSLVTNLAKEKNLSKIYGSVDVKNLKSLKIHKKFGSKVIGRYIYLKLLVFEKIWYMELENGKKE